MDEQKAPIVPYDWAFVFLLMPVIIIMGAEQTKENNMLPTVPLSLQPILHTLL